MESNVTYRKSGRRRRSRLRLVGSCVHILQLLLPGEYVLLQLPLLRDGHVLLQLPLPRDGLSQLHKLLQLIQLLPQVATFQPPLHREYVDTPLPIGDVLVQPRLLLLRDVLSPLHFLPLLVLS